MKIGKSICTLEITYKCIKFNFVVNSLFGIIDVSLCSELFVTVLALIRFLTTTHTQSVHSSKQCCGARRYLNEHKQVVRDRVKLCIGVVS